MRLPWNKSKVEQLDLLDEANAASLQELFSSADTASLLREAYVRSEAGETRGGPNRHRLASPRRLRPSRQKPRNATASRLWTWRDSARAVRHELSKLHHEEPERARAVVDGNAEITRTAVTAMRTGAAPTSSAIQAHATCTWLEQALACLNQTGHPGSGVELVALLQRMAALPSRFGLGV
jgi:hypothetical protein